MDSKDINREIFGAKEDEDLVSLTEMKENFELIKEHIPNFKKNFNEISDNKLNVTNIDIHKITEKSIKEANLNKEDERIIDGFYGTWMSIFMMVGSDKEALEIVFKMIHSEG